MIKTKIICIGIKGTTSLDHACGNCFSKIDKPADEEFCWSCGADLSDDNWAYSLEDLLKKAE